jgi:thiol-disulfide isomerase/thioredoxin
MGTHNDEPNAAWIEERLEMLRPAASWEPDAQRGLARFRQRQRRPPSRRWIWVTAGAAAACVSLMASPVTRAFAERCVYACVSQTGWVQQLFGGSGPSVAYIKPANRRPASDFTLEDASGNAVQLSQLRGKVVLLNFWATWCAPCRVEMPWFVQFQKAGQGRGFEVLGVSLDEDGWKSVMPYLWNTKVNYPVVLGNQDLLRPYSSELSLPTTLLIDRAGRVASIHVGLCSRSEYENDIRAVMNE